ncbi:MAG: hypothetical protein ACFNTA_08170 [Campylobacter sp.]|uniref:hypothetical protein n=1 Tax=Campylobacter sp. TaxID=205 RepID=UPI00360C9A3D
MDGEKIDLIDEILIFFQEKGERFPRLKAEASIYEIKESLVFLKDFQVNNDSKIRDKCLEMFDDYISRLFYISLKKTEKKGARLRPRKIEQRNRGIRKNTATIF